MTLVAFYCIIYNIFIIPQSKIFSKFPYLFLLWTELFRSLWLFYKYVDLNFSIIDHNYTVVREHILYNFIQFQFVEKCPMANIWSFLTNVPCALGNDGYLAVAGYKVLVISISKYVNYVA